MTMPYGFPWIVKEDHDRSEYAKSMYRAHEGGTIVPWDCMVEFGMDHDHDAEECERTMAYMSDPFDGFDFSDRYNEVDEFGQTSWVD